MSPALDSSLASLEEHVGTIEKVGINALNDDCLTFVMVRYLPIVDRVRMERVCKRCQAVSLNAWHNFKKLNFNNKYWGFSAPITLAEVNHRIRLKFNERLDQNVVSSVTRFCPNVQHLDVWRLKISLRSWKSQLVVYLKNINDHALQETDCRDLMNMRNTGVVELIEESQPLEHLLRGLRDYIEKAARGGHKSDEETFDY
ncbi:hypothetical protein TSAR_012212 [Trichomalopsis sarcophagae]|uniref:F-box domain-containing protein n=1 Tax=Trichomalopsis sarcophagae TaxID=543379 RepID=A0A232ED73_9HYME|nr:hypothetical protein TSAR_012212 [Trichomalopsis sarcophagae]